jgi:hypothetical protein
VERHRQEQVVHRAPPPQALGIVVERGQVAGAQPEVPGRQAEVAPAGEQRLALARLDHRHPAVTRERLPQLADAVGRAVHRHQHDRVQARRQDAEHEAQLLDAAGGRADGDDGGTGARGHGSVLPGCSGGAEGLVARRAPPVQRAGRG